jgi:hypothetical protein
LFYGSELIPRLFCLAWSHADVLFVIDNDLLILLTLCGIIMLVTSLVGLSGTILNSRPLLATYALLLWPAFISILAIGYLSYKRYAFSLDLKLNRAWSQYYTPLGRLIIQNSLQCCGFRSPLDQAAVSKRCHTRSPLPGCKTALYQFRKEMLATMWGAAFGIVPVHIVNIFVSLLCANHVTSWFGKGITPRKYRLTRGDVLDQLDETKLTRPGYTKHGTSGSMLREDRVFL